MENKKNTKQVYMTQKAKIKKHLLTGKPITSIEAIELYDCTRLASQIFGLRSEGLNIEMNMIKDENGKRCA